MAINQDDMERAVEYLANSDEDYARAKALYDGLMEQRKVVKAKAFLRSREGPQTAKEQDAYASQAYQEHLQKIEVANLEYLTLHTKRSTETIVIDCWRSLNAARRKGQFI